MLFIGILLEALWPLILVLKAEEQSDFRFLLVKVCFAFVVLFAPTWLSGRKSPYWHLRQLVSN